MSRNREKNSQSLHWMGVVKWVIILGLFSVLGLGYMLCKNRNLHLAEETHKVQVQLAALQERNAELTLDLETMKTPRGLERRLLAMHSSLVRLDQMRGSVVPMDQSTRMRLVRIGTRPQSDLNVSASAVAAEDTTAHPAPTPAP